MMERQILASGVAVFESFYSQQSRRGCKLSCLCLGECGSVCDVGFTTGDSQEGC